MTRRVAFPFVGDSLGGSHVSAALLMKALPAEGFAPVAIVHDEGPLQDWLVRRGVPTMPARLPYLRSDVSGAAAFARVVGMAPQLAGFLRRNSFDLVHANDGRMISTWMLPARLGGIPAVAHRRTRWSPSRMAALSFRLARGIIAISTFVRDSMPPALARRAVVVANPFEMTSPDRAAGRQKVRDLIGADGFVAAFVGTLQSQKRPDTFLRAASIIHKRRPDTRFLMIGRSGDSGAEVRRMVEDCGLSGFVTLTGFRDDVGELLKGCDLLIAPAVDEGHGRVLIEAMAAGVPVIAAASGGHIEVVAHEQTGLLFAPDDPAGGAEAALRIIGNPDRAQIMAAAAKAWTMEQFSPERHAKAVAAIYRRLLQEAP